MNYRGKLSPFVMFTIPIFIGLTAGEMSAQPLEAPPPPGFSRSVDSARTERGRALVVSLFTYGPGDAFFERFGHAALGIRDTISGDDFAFNWGMFDQFDQQFLVRFMTGDTKYSMAGFPTTLFNDVYKRENRSIRRQTLALTPLQAAAVLEFVSWNATEEHKYYRYDYYNDNCSTRVRDVVNWALGGALRNSSHDAVARTIQAQGASRSWRGETARVFAYSLPLYAGVQIALGKNADRPLSRWHEDFLPEHLADHWTTVRIADGDGHGERALVLQDTVLFTSTRERQTAQPPMWTIQALIVGTLLAGMILMLAKWSSRPARIALTAFVGSWFIVGGLTGTLLLLAGTLTRHSPYMGRNVTALALNPLLLIAAPIAAIAVWRSQSTTAVRVVTTSIAMLSIIAAAVVLSPAWKQESSVVLAIVVPVHIAIGIAIRLLPARVRSHPAR